MVNWEKEIWTRNIANEQRCLIPINYLFQNRVFVNKMMTLTVVELKELLEADKSIQLIDVRESFEWDICHIEGAQLMPMNSIPDMMEDIDKNKRTVVYCHHGMRSQRVIDYLVREGFDNLLNLEGGIHAWAIQVDADMEKY
tara:strand:- start:403 stop:825 length:423 start_codon:yes stop_codon:yes gene_type:complete